MWERSWNVAELRKGSSNWTLAADAGVRRSYFYSLCTNGFEVFRDLNTFSGDCIFVPFAKLNSFAVALRHHIIYMKVTFNLHIVQLPLISDVFVRCKNQIYLLRRNWSKVN